MANQWYYNRDGEQQGPISDTDLRKLAADGSLNQDDQIWKEGMAEWRKAGAMKGLFADAKKMPPPIPAVAPALTDNPSSDVAREKKSRASFGESAKFAGQLVAKQAELTKIQQVSLPGLYAKIGNQVFADGSQKQRHETLFDEIERLNKTISDLEQAGDKQPEAKTFSDKAMALGGKAATATRLKAAQLQRRQKHVALGKSVFEEGQTPDICKSEKASIDGLLARSEELRAETSTVKEQLSEQRREAAQTGRSFFASTTVVLSLAVLCAPIGLFLIWRHPTWSKDTKKKWAGVSVACFLVFAVFAKMQEAATLKELAAADQLWDDGDNADAIDEYRKLIGESSLPSSEVPRLYRRVIEFDCEHDNIESARSLIERAYNSGVNLTLTNSMAKSLLSEVQSANEAKDRNEGEKIGAKSIESGSDESSELDNDENKFLSVMALMAVNVVSDNQAWGSTTPDKFNSLMQTAASELANAGQPAAQRFRGINPFSSKDVQAGKNQGKIITYGDVSCRFIRNPRTGRYALLEVHIDGKKYSILGVGQS